MTEYALNAKKRTTKRRTKMKPVDYYEDEYGVHRLVGVIEAQIMLVKEGSNKPEEAIERIDECLQNYNKGRKIRRAKIEKELSEVLT
jgi:hypothetical protein